MRPTPDPLAGLIRCDGCHQTIWWPRLLSNSGGAYFNLCARCHYQQDKQFTAENAILEAMAIVAGTPIVIRPCVKVGT